MTTTGTTSIGNGAGTMGTVNIQNGGIWNASGNVSVGDGGTGNLNILNGGVVNFTATQFLTKWHSPDQRCWIQAEYQWSCAILDWLANIGWKCYGSERWSYRLRRGGNKYAICWHLYRFVTAVLRSRERDQRHANAGPDVSIGGNWYNTTGTGTNVGTLSLVAGGTLTVAVVVICTLEDMARNCRSFYAYGGTGIINIGSTTGTSGAAGTSGTLVYSGNMYLEGNSQINFNNIDTTTLAANILNQYAGMTLALSKVGSGTAILTGNSTYNGTTTISAGVLQLGNGGTTGSVATAITDNAQLTLNRSDTGLVLSGSDQRHRDPVQNGTGTSILTGANTYSGGTTISAGTLQLGNAATTGSIVGNDHR